MNSPVLRNIAFVLLGVAGLLLKSRYSGPCADAVHSYAGNLSVSFAVYFIFASSRLGRQFGKAATTVAALLVVQSFEATNGFGVMAMRGENRCRVTLQLTFLESNVAELPEIVRLAANLGVDRVKGHHVWAHFRELQPLNLRRNADSIRRWNDAVSQAREVAAQHSLPNGQAVLLENFHPLDGAVANASPTMSRCPFLGREAWVSAEGRFSPCCAPDAQRRALGEFGNLNDLSLGKVWDSREYQHLVHTYHSRPLCQQCTLRQPV